MTNLLFPKFQTKTSDFKRKKMFMCINKTEERFIICDI